MNFDLGPDEQALRDGIRELCEKRFPMERVRKGFDRDMWRELAQVGVFSLRTTLGLGMTEAVVVFQELGRALIPGPLVGTHLAGRDDVIAMNDGSGYVAYGAEADGVLMLDGSIETDVTGEDVEPLDPLTPIRKVAPAIADSPLGEDGRVLTAALSAGIAAKTAELAVAHAKERVQFDRPIGSFQAVKHICADMFVAAEVARAAVDAAGVMLDAGDSTAVAPAKLIASEAAIANGKACVQVHGGMGFTWEVDAHLYLKRAAVLATQFGGIDAQAEAVAASL